MTTLKEENNRFREAYNGMSQYEKNKIAGEDNPRTRQEELALMEETAQISKTLRLAMDYAECTMLLFLPLKLMKDR